MTKRNRSLRAVELLLAAAFVIFLFFIEFACVASWFCTSMDNALVKLDSSLNESSENTFHDFNQQFWSHEQILKLRNLKAIK